MERNFAADAMLVTPAALILLDLQTYQHRLAQTALTIVFLHVHFAKESRVQVVFYGTTGAQTLVF